MIRILLSVVLFLGVLMLIDYVLTGGYATQEASRMIGRVLS